MRPPVSIPLAPNLLPSGQQEWWTCSHSLCWITSWASQWQEGRHEATCPQGEGHWLSQAASGFRAQSQRTEALLSQQGESDAKFPRASNIHGWTRELSSPPFASLVNDVWFDLFSFSWTICARQGWPALFQGTFISQPAVAKAPSSHLLAMIHSHTFTLWPIVDHGHKGSEGIPACRETGFVHGSSIIQQWGWMTEASWNSLHFWMKKLLQQPLTGRLRKQTLLSLIIFSCLRDGGWELFLVVGMQCLKIFYLLKRSYVVVIQITQLRLTYMKTISWVQWKRKCSAFSTRLRGNRYSSLLKSIALL